MKHLWIKIAATLCISALLLSGCGKEEKTGGAAGSEYWITWPAVDFGTMEYCGLIREALEEDSSGAD